MTSITLTQTDIKRFWSKVYIVNDGTSCWPWTGSTFGGGYGEFSLNGRQEVAHRVALVLKDGDIAHGMLALHTCDHRPCVRPGHVYPGTHADNVRDCEQRGRGNHLKGDAHPKRLHPPKLSREIANRIPVLYATGRYTQRELGAKYGVTQSVTSRIVNGKEWNCITKDGKC